MTSTYNVEYINILCGPAAEQLVEGLQVGFEIDREDAPGTFEDTFRVVLDLSRVTPIGSSGSRFIISGFALNWLPKNTVVNLYYNTDNRQGYFELNNVGLKPSAAL